MRESSQAVAYLMKAARSKPVSLWMMKTLDYFLIFDRFGPLFVSTAFMLAPRYSSGLDGLGDTHCSGMGLTCSRT